MNKFWTYVKPDRIILFILAVYIITNFCHHNWTRDQGPYRGVIQWDVISYYAYLPATFIYNDLKLDFLDDPGFHNDNKMWPTSIENGNNLIITSMGLSMMYAPFFFMAHLLAPIFHEPRTGYNSIYQFFLVFGALTYVALALFVLKKILLLFYSPLITAITLLCIGLGTNLYYYSTFAAAVPHSFNFALIIFFLYAFIRWYEEPGIGNSVVNGLLIGLITLIRPTNALVLVVFWLWGVASLQDLKGRLKFYLRHLPAVGIMLFCIFIVWLPQLLYWKFITGHYLFYSYGPHGGNFYFSHPHLASLLVSYKKGWFVYTPLMLLVVPGLFLVRRQARGTLLPVAIFLVLFIYLQASWWCWWFGGSFGSRVFVDSYGIMAIPLAAVIGAVPGMKRRISRVGSGLLLTLLVLFQLFQTLQYSNGAIHYMGMNKDAYWETFLKLKPTGRFWNLLTIPDSDLGRLGIYVYYDTGENVSYLKNMEKKEALRVIRKQIDSNQRLTEEIHRYAKREDVDTGKAIDMVAEKIYKYKVQ